MPPAVQTAATSRHVFTVVEALLVGSSYSFTNAATATEDDYGVEHEPLSPEEQSLTRRTCRWGRRSGLLGAWGTPQRRAQGIPCRQ
jgi:hypothetical protein